jgi:hypothetical protein
MPLNTATSDPLLWLCHTQRHTQKIELYLRQRVQGRNGDHSKLYDASLLMARSA